MIEKIKTWIKCICKKIKIFSAKDKKKTVAILCIAAVFILFLSGFIIGRVTFSKQNTLNNLENALNKKNYYKINKICRVEQESTKSKSDLKPFADYFSDGYRINSLISSLRNTGKYDDFIELKHKKWLFFDNYYLSIKRVDIKVNVNFANTKIYLNDKEKYITKSENEIITINNIIPGIYKLKAINKNNFDELNFDKEITVVKNGELFNANLKGTRISINCEYPDADVYINGKAINIKAGDFVNKGPFNYDKNTEIYIEKDFPWGKIQSSKVKISEDPIIHIKMKLNNEKLESILYETIEECVKSIFEAMNDENPNIIKSKNKEKIYNEFVAERKLLRNHYELSQYDFKINESEIKKEDNTFYANIYTTLRYKISKKILGLQLFSEDREKKVFFKIQMNKDESWEITDVYVVK